MAITVTVVSTFSRRRAHMFLHIESHGNTSQNSSAQHIISLISPASSPLSPQLRFSKATIHTVNRQEQGLRGQHIDDVMYT